MSYIDAYKNKKRTEVLFDKKRQRGKKLYKKRFSRLAYRLGKNFRVDVVIVITESLNNFFITISNLKGSVRKKGSLGTICRLMDIVVKKTPLSVELLGRYMARVGRSCGFKTYNFVISKKSTIMTRSAVKGFRSVMHGCYAVKFVESISHNGVKLRRRKRK